MKAPCHSVKTRPSSYRIILFSADEVTPAQHVDIQAAAQLWVDSSISKTANVPTAFPYTEFKDILCMHTKRAERLYHTFRF